MAEWAVMMNADEIALTAEAMLWLSNAYKNEPPAAYATLAHKMKWVAVCAMEDLVSLNHEVPKSLRENINRL
jgi:hypothetical protein